MPVSARCALRGLAAVLLALTAAGCQVSLAGDIAIDADGSGTMTVRVRVDEELTAMLSDAGVDPTAGLSAEDDGTFEVTTSREDGARTVEVRTSFETPRELAARVRELHRGLDETDPRILRDAQLEVSGDGAASLTATAGLVLPEVLGAEGDGITFDREDLEELLEERGEELVRYDLRVTMPGPITETDADERDAATAVWHLPVGGERSISVRSESPRSRTPWLAAAVAVVTAVAVAAGVVLWGRRSRGVTD